MVAVIWFESSSGHTCTFESKEIEKNVIKFIKIFKEESWKYGFSVFWTSFLGLS